MMLSSPAAFVISLSRLFQNLEQRGVLDWNVKFGMHPSTSL